MPYTAFKHTHVLFAVLLILLLLIKTVLLVFNKSDALRKLRAKTKVLDMIFGTLIIITGGYMLYKTIEVLESGKVETYLIVKIVVTLIGIPLGIVAFKKENKVLAVVTFLAFVYVYGIAETKSWKFKKEAAAQAPVEQSNGKQLSVEDVKALYLQECGRCHGEDGKRGELGAKDLTVINLSTEETKEVIGNGRGTMPGFKQKLTENEIEALANYVHEL